MLKHHMDLPVWVGVRPVYNLGMADHRVQYCDWCESDMVICGTCGNITCNGGAGMVNGAPCPDCPSAYDLAKSLGLVFQSSDGETRPTD
jgi:hypothetical protein